MIFRAFHCHNWQDMVTEEADVDLALREEAAALAADFRRFIRAAWHVLEPGPLCDEWYIDAIADHMTAVRALQILNLWVHIRPRMLKTTICSVMFDAWVWASDPSRRVLSSSFSDDRRKDDCRRTRDLVESAWYRAHWPDVALTDDQNEKHRFSLATGGHRFTAIYGSGATGDGGHILRMDDPQCAADMDSRVELDRDHEWFYSTWERRADDPQRTPIVGVMQHLGPFDLASRLRVDDPARWEVLSLESRRAAVPVTNLWRRTGDDRLEPVEVPRTDTLLTRTGRFVDPREPGELLSSRIDGAKLDALRRARPGEYAAQEDQAPILATSGNAQIHGFDRTRHMRSFAARMGAPDLRSAVARALREGWQATTGWDHGQSAGRECCVVILWNDRLQEAWVVGFYANPRRTVPKQDATAVRRLLDALGIPVRAIVNSLGDVGTLGKGTTAESVNAAVPINTELATVRDESGMPILGFPIFTPQKEAGSVTRGVELLNMVLGSNGLYLDESVPDLAVALECWTGTEAYKDPCDALRYPVRVIAERWLNMRPGVSQAIIG